jgi:hypothetical protein
MKKEKQA